MTRSVARLALLAAALTIGGCSPDETPTGTTAEGEAAAMAAATASFGPFPARATVFVDVANTTGTEDGSRAHPFNTLTEGLGAARGGDVVGLAPGVYAERFGDLQPNYVIQGHHSFKLLGMGPGRTIIRGDHSFSLIRVQDGPSGIIANLTIEQGGRLQNSEGGGLQVLGFRDSVSLTVSHVIFRGNQAVNGGAISAEGRVRLRLVDVLVADNLAGNAAGGVFLEGANGRVRATFKNVTITANSGSFRIGGILVENDARLNLLNSIVWNNGLADVLAVGGAHLHTNYSDVGGGLLPGIGNLSTDPRFLDPAGGNFRLHSRSPAVDAGTDAGAPTSDILGVARPLDGNGDGVAVTDMGAYEVKKIFTTP
jgi:predicted outer membrane repeat protein